MPARVTYWTGTWDPAREAISKEVNALRVGDRARAPVVSISPEQPVRLSMRSRVLTLPVKLWPVLRAVAAVVEPLGDVTHVFGGQFSWHPIRALGRRPIILTAVVPQSGTERLPASTLAQVVVESEASIDEWVEAGVPHGRIQVVYPGVDLRWYSRLAAPPNPRPSLIFASTPADPAELEARGIRLLVELARHRRDIDVIIPWRSWGDVEAARRALTALGPPDNFVVSFGDRADMRELYAQAWGTIACFAPGAGKTCPNFVVEGLACGRPAIVTPGVGLSREIARHQAGLVADRSVPALSAAVDALLQGWPALSDRARALAERHFNVSHFRAGYEALYDATRSAQASPVWQNG
jgi:glycosyltransferase involved in cell wall biosynthesis